MLTGPAAKQKSGVVRLQLLPSSLLTGPAAKKSGVVRLQLLTCSPLAGPVATKSHVYFFFSCIAGRVRDMVGQLLEIRVELKANWMQKFPWKREKQQEKQNPKHTHQQTANTNTTAREIRKTK